MSDRVHHLHAERARLALANERAPSAERARRILDIDWELAAIPPPPPTGGEEARLREADRMAILDGFDPRMS